jgi:hypothetical protein
MGRNSVEISEAQTLVGRWVTDTVSVLYVQIKKIKVDKRKVRKPSESNESLAYSIRHTKTIHLAFKIYLIKSVLLVCIKFFSLGQSQWCIEDDFYPL